MYLLLVKIFQVMIMIMIVIMKILMVIMKTLKKEIVNGIKFVKVMNTFLPLKTLDYNKSNPA